MADLDGLFEEFIKSQLAGERPDPFEYLERADESDRYELGDLIDIFLERAPLDPFDAEAYSGSRAAQIVDQVHRSLNGVSGNWPSLLPRVRRRLEMQRQELIARLADALGVGDKQEKVGAYYHEMEQGVLPSDGVSDRVLEALGSIIGIAADALRRSGAVSGTASGQASSASDVAFAARTALPDPDYMPEGDVVDQAVGPAEFDEVDRLFRGGSES